MVRIEAQLTVDELIVRLRGHGPTAILPKTSGTKGKLRRIELLTPAIGSCVSCGEDACFRHVAPAEATVNRERIALLLAGPSPEFERYTPEKPMSVLIPLDGQRWHLQRFAITTGGYLGFARQQR